ncbi:hypothetical protein CASFOL_001920 [Castilleja foliolosa]|uniref:Myb/SANT-like domain-containing protein n=1 Tax=Castilleja foliolosa TaxID=1961234 RepID=A0ABD3EGD6_9LAMI
MGSQGNNGVKAKWTPDNHKMFVELCLEQISKGNKPGSHFTSKGWKNIVDSFHSIAGLKYDKTQLKNHWDTTKKNWKIWHDLVSDERMKWDPDRRSFGADELEWDEYLQEIPEAAQFRFKELLFAEKLDIVFAPTENSNGKKVNCFTGAESVPQKRKHNSYYNPDDEYLELEGPIDAKPVSERFFYDAFEPIQMQSPPFKLSYSIEECIKCLDSTEEIEQGCELYLFALDLFLKKEYREIFLNLKRSSVRIAWLERLQSNGLPLPLS